LDFCDAPAADIKNIHTIHEITQSNTKPHEVTNSVFVWLRVALCDFVDRISFAGRTLALSQAIM
jgi:hypothetical protein